MLFNTDPLFALAEVAMQIPCSPVLNNGNAIATTEYNFLGTPRPYPDSGGVDMGAFELPAIIDNANSLILSDDLNEGIHMRYGNPSVNMIGKMKSGYIVNIGANNSILLEQGFEAVSGSVFSAIIESLCP